MPTSTWGAYNFYDADGDGWGDTWYARWHTMHVDLTRPHATRGVPYRYRSYDLSFQHWLVTDGAGRRCLRRRGHRDVRVVDRSPHCVRLAGLPGPHGVRHRGALRPRRGLPRPRRQPDVSLGQQLLPTRQSHGPSPVADRRVARPRPPGIEPARGAVRRQRPRPTARAVHRRRRRRRTVGVLGHRAPATARRSASTASRSMRGRNGSARRTRRCSQRSRISSGPAARRR